MDKEQQGLVAIQFEKNNSKIDMYGFNINKDY